jgi:hypothetical protein
LLIRLGQDGDLELKFQIRDTPVAELWTERMQLAVIIHWTIQIDFMDLALWHKNRPVQWSIFNFALPQLMHTIQIHRPFEYTQDCLNYLHNIFERYHGLLDQQHSDYWSRAPESVRKALAELNLAVHRCESVASGTNPRFVCTWYGMPKTHQLALDLQEQYTESQIKFGTVYLNYCEIGKTAEDLANDNDKYIGDDAFQPFDHYSADFNVQFTESRSNNRYGKIQTILTSIVTFSLLA